MKQQRFRFKLLALFLFALFFLLAAYGAYSVMTYGNRWFASSKNPRVRLQKESVTAGDILDRNGVLLATNDENGDRVYQSNRLARCAMVHLIGDSKGRVSNGVETFQTSYLYGFHASLPELTAGLLLGDKRRGDNVTLTVDSRLCTQMAAFFAQHAGTRGKNGAAVAINYRTGEVLGMVSLPSFDPMAEGEVSEAGQPYWNRVTQSLYPPGSTFKMVTAAAALAADPALPDDTFPCCGLLEAGGEVIHDYGNERHGEVNLRRAFAESCNGYFADLALRLGDEKLKRAAVAFGFGDNFLFRDLVVENSVYPANRTEVEVAATGFGQSGLAATPMHLCMIAAAVANQGVMMEPRLLLRVSSPNGTPRLSFTSKEYRKAMSAETAAVLRDVMRTAVTNGTASRAGVEGLTICGKTGTADSTQNGQAVTYGWFVGFCGMDEAPYAVSVVVEDIAGGQTGGTTAALIAHDMFEALCADVME